MKSVRPRDLALRVLNHRENSPGFSDRYLEYLFQQAPHLNARDRAFTVHLVQGVFRWRLRLDWIIRQHIRFPFSKIRLPVLNILRLGLYQIFFMDRTPESAAVNEAVKQAKVIESEHVAGFVNGILRHICRKKRLITFPDREQNQVHYLSVVYSYPTWLVEKWIREMGTDSAESMLSAGNRIPGIVIRVNTLKVDRSGLIKRLKTEGVEGKPTTYSPQGIAVQALKKPIDQLNAYRQGLFQVQGEAAQICIHLFSPKPGEKILDICAGLGGKSTQSAELMEGKGDLVALDMNHKRLISLEKNSQRLGIACIRSVVADAATDPLPVRGKSFDKILIDAPCSALGTISRHPDAKWMRNETDIKRLSVLQAKILNNASPFLREGGKLLYVTCTHSREENDEVIDAFLKKNRTMVLQDLRNLVPPWGIDLIDDHGFFRTLPHVHQMEGFFAALFVKNMVTV